MSFSHYSPFCLHGVAQIMMIFPPEQVVFLFSLITIATLSNNLAPDHCERPDHGLELKSSNKLKFDEP